MKVIVIDASVALKWQLRDEADVDRADSILLDFAHGRVELIAPSLWLYEVTNGIRTAVVRGRLSADQGREAAKNFLHLGVHLHPFFPIAVHAYDLACRYGLAVYDSVYIALAKQYGAELYTADGPFYDKIKGSLGFVKWFTEYQRAELSVGSSPL